VLAISAPPSDDGMMQVLVERHWPTAGHDVVIARRRTRKRSGSSGAKRTDLMLSFLTAICPAPAGSILCARCRQILVLRHIPIIMQTSAGRVEEIREGIDAGVYYYLNKAL